MEDVACSNHAGRSNIMFREKLMPKQKASQVTIDLDQIAQIGPVNGPKLLEVSELLHKHWPGVMGNIHYFEDKGWAVCYQPGEWTTLGNTTAEIEAYLTSHPMTHEKVMEDFTNKIAQMFPGMSFD